MFPGPGLVLRVLIGSPCPVQVLISLPNRLFSADLKRSCKIPALSNPHAFESTCLVDKKVFHHSVRPKTSFLSTKMTSTSNVGNEEQSKQLRSYEDLRGAGQSVMLSADAKRIFWPLNGPLTTSICIMEGPFTPDSREPYFRKTGGADTVGTGHSVSQSPLTDPKVSSITVHVDTLDQWENN
jgi:hypothetical protein